MVTNLWPQFSSLPHQPFTIHFHPMLPFFSLIQLLQPWHTTHANKSSQAYWLGCSAVYLLLAHLNTEVCLSDWEMNAVNCTPKTQQCGVNVCRTFPSHVRKFGQCRE